MLANTTCRVEVTGPPENESSESSGFFLHLPQHGKVICACFHVPPTRYSDIKIHVYNDQKAQPEITFKASLLSDVPTVIRLSGDRAVPPQIQ